MPTSLETMISAIQPINLDAVQAASDHLDQLTKPPGSLGKLEEIAKQLAGITGITVPKIGKRQSLSWQPTMACVRRELALFHLRLLSKWY